MTTIQRLVTWDSKSSDAEPILKVTVPSTRALGPGSRIVVICGNQTRTILLSRLFDPMHPSNVPYFIDSTAESKPQLETASIVIEPSDPSTLLGTQTAIACAEALWSSSSYLPSATTTTTTTTATTATTTSATIPSSSKSSFRPYPKPIARPLAV